MNILVAGASGSIGLLLIAELVRRGHDRGRCTHHRGTRRGRRPGQRVRRRSGRTGNSGVTG